MPTNLHSFSNTEFQMRWREPYVTEGLNKKLFGLVTPGIYRGFELGEHVSDLTITVSPDTTHFDHLAVINTQTGYSLTIRKDDGAFNLDLSSYASQTVVVAMYVDYVVGTDTTGVVSGYTVAEYDALTDIERLELCVLGTVIVPASGVIPAGNISNYRRSALWLSESAYIAPVPLVENGGFEANWYGWGSSDYKTPCWEFDSGPSITLGIGPNTTERVMQVSAGATGTTGGYFDLFQRMQAPVEEGRKIRAFLSLKSVDYVATAGDLGVEFTFSQTGIVGDTVVTETASFSVDLTTLSSEYTTYQAEVEVPANVGSLMLVKFTGQGIDYPAPGPGGALAFKIADVGAFYEVKSPVEAANFPMRVRRQVAASSLMLEDLAATSPDDKLAILDYDATTPANFGSVRVRNRSYSGGARSPAFDANRFIVGWNLGGSTDNEIPRFQMGGATAPDTRTLIMEMADTYGSSGLTRVYVDEDGSLLVTTNAAFSDTAEEWVKDETTQEACIYSFGKTSAGRSFHKIREAASIGSWADTAWDRTVSEVNAVATALKSTDVNALRVLSAVGTDSTDGLYPKLLVESPATGNPLNALVSKFDNLNAKSLRQYALAGGGLEAQYGEFMWTMNAGWTGSQWAKDVTGEEAYAIRFRETTLQILGKEAATNTWSTWSAQVLAEFDVANLVVKLPTTALQMTDLGPSTTDSVAHKLIDKTLMRGWVYVTFSASSYTLWDGIGVSSVSLAVGSALVTIVDSMASITDGLITATVIGAPGAATDIHYVRPTWNAVNQIRLQFYDRNWTLINPTTYSGVNIGVALSWHGDLA